MKRILVPTDFSACARAAENLALALASRDAMEVYFLHVLNAPDDWVKASPEKKKLYPELSAKAAKAENELNALLDAGNKISVKAKKILRFDSSFENILAQLNDYECDFIVMGSHGASGIKAVLGSNAAKVIRNSNTPVLVVKTQCRLEQMKSMVFASSFEEDDRKSFEFAREIASLMNVNIHLLFVNTPSWFTETDDMLARMHAFKVKAGAPEAELHIFNGLNEERGIEKFSRLTKADIIALTTHGRKGIMRFISPSITEALINHSDLPVLSINMK